MSRISNFLVIFCIASIAFCVGLISYSTLGISILWTGVFGAVSFLGLVAVHSLSVRATKRNELVERVSDLDRLTQQVLSDNASIRERVAIVASDQRGPISSRTRKLESSVKFLSKAVRELTRSAADTERALGLPARIEMASGWNDPEGSDNALPSGQMPGLNAPVSPTFGEAAETSVGGSPPANNNSQPGTDVPVRDEDSWSGRDPSNRRQFSAGNSGMTQDVPSRNAQLEPKSAASSLRAGWSDAVEGFHEGAQGISSPRQNQALARGAAVPETGISSTEFHRTDFDGNPARSQVPLASGSRRRSIAEAASEISQAIAASSKASVSPPGGRARDPISDRNAGEFGDDRLALIRSQSTGVDSAQIQIGGDEGLSNVSSVRSAMASGSFPPPKSERASVGAPPPPVAVPGASDIESAAIEALKAGKGQVYLEPMVRLPMRKVAAYRSEVRMQSGDATLGALVPAAQILKERSNLAISSQFLVEKSFNVIARLSERSQAISIYAAVSGHLISRPSTLKWLVRFLRSQSKASLNRLMLEFSERDIADFGVLEQESLRRLRGLGLRFSVGKITNFSHDFSLLSSLGFRSVKLSGEVIASAQPVPGQEIQMSDQARALHRLGIDLVAVDIQEEAFVPTLIEYDIFYAVGPLFAKPRAVKREVLETPSERTIKDQASTALSA